MKRHRAHTAIFMFLVAALSLHQGIATALGATFDIVSEQSYAEWRSILYQNRNGGRYFCALQSDARGTTFRINQYKDTRETFLELYNPTWTKMEGDVRFTLRFERQGNNIRVDLRGKSWGDSYTYDILDQKSFDDLMVLLADSSSVSLINSNSIVMETFSLTGSVDAAVAFLNCISTG